MELDKGVYYISGIDTDIGKTVCTGVLAREAMQRGQAVITQKLIQTGCDDVAEDVERHRELMGLAPDERFLEDQLGLTSPAVYAYPASPHLAAKLENRPVDLDRMRAATKQLAKRYDIVLVEGAGGLMVPLTEEVLFVEYLAATKAPCILVTSGRLGSINHTLLSLQALKHYDIPLYALVFNGYTKSEDSIIEADTRSYLQHALRNYYPTAHWYEIDAVKA